MISIFCSRVHNIMYYRERIFFYAQCLLLKVHTWYILVHWLNAYWKADVSQYLHHDRRTSIYTILDLKQVLRWLLTPIWEYDSLNRNLLTVGSVARKFSHSSNNLFGIPVSLPKTEKVAKWVTWRIYSPELKSRRRMTRKNSQIPS